MGQYLYLLVIFFLLLTLGWVLYIESRLKKFFKGANGKDMESVLVSIKNELERMNQKEKGQDETIESIEKRLKRSVQHVNTVRFNPFEDSGSNQSFATALLDEEGNGVAISTLYSRDKVGIYAKAIEKFNSQYSLSEEEKEVIEKARKS